VDFYLADFLLRQLGKYAVLVACAEINVDAPDLVAFEAEELGIAKAFPALGHTSVGHKGPFTLNTDSFQFLPLDPVAAAPASLEISRLVDRITGW